MTNRREEEGERGREGEQREIRREAEIGRAEGEE
jgi:hypothetical protein